MVKSPWLWNRQPVDADGLLEASGLQKGSVGLEGRAVGKAEVSGAGVNGFQIPGQHLLGGNQLAATGKDCPIRRQVPVADQNAEANGLIARRKHPGILFQKIADVRVI